MKVIVSQSCLTLCDSMDCSPPGSSIYGILQARILEGSYCLMMNTGEMITDVGTVLSGSRAVKEGLINEIGNLSRVIEELYNMIEN